jgi:opacity protein-like surface antigen
MKKVILTTMFAFATLFASAQFAVITNVDMPEDGEGLQASSLTDNLGIGYQLNSKIMVGAVKNGEDYDLFGRYYINDIYVSLQGATEEMADNLNIGVGYSFNMWRNLYIEPNYSMPTNEDAEGNREGEFKLGVAYKF